MVFNRGRFFFVDNLTNQPQISRSLTDPVNLRL